MAVIINELEVVVDAQEPGPPDEAQRSESAPLLRPEDVNDILERQVRLLTRVLAH